VTRKKTKHIPLFSSLVSYQKAILFPKPTTTPKEDINKNIQTVKEPKKKLYIMASPKHATAITVQPSSPRFPASGTPTAGAQRKIGIAVDLSDESAFAVKWAVQNYLRPGDAVILVHVRPTSVLYGADWGAIDVAVAEDEQSQQKLEHEFDAFTSAKANDLAQPLVEAQIPFKIHIVKDHDMKERLCLEVERLGLSTVIMGSRGFGASRRASKARLGSVSDYCVHHCVCPVVIVRFPDDKDVEKVVLEEDPEYHDALD
jgi:nucleotide-binding universal stress UspA family protein